MQYLDKLLSLFVYGSSLMSDQLFKGSFQTDFFLEMLKTIISLFYLILRGLKASKSGCGLS